MTNATVMVEMTADDNWALLGVSNMLQSLDDVFGRTEERSRALAQVNDLQRRYRLANPLPPVSGDVGKPKVGAES